MNETPQACHAVFQNFDDPPAAAVSAPHVAALREELQRRGLDGFIVPHADRFQNEYLPPSEARLEWLTGFSGSAGVAVIMADRAALFVDGRYTLAAKEQVDPALFTIEHLIERPPAAWIEVNLTAGQRLGYDPWLHSAEAAERYVKACAAAGVTLVATEPIRSMKSGATVPHHRADRWCRTTCGSPANRLGRSLDACVPRLPSSRPMRW